MANYAKKGCIHYVYCRGKGRGYFLKGQKFFISLPHHTEFFDILPGLHSEKKWLIVMIKMVMMMMIKRQSVTLLFKAGEK